MPSVVWGAHVGSIWLAVALLPVLALLLVLRTLQVIARTHKGSYRPSPASRPKQSPCRLAVFLGSGGHTGEMVRLLAGIDFGRYTPRTYIISSGDALSLAKVSELERVRAATSMPTDPPQWSVVEIPRARRVHQSFLTAPFSTLRSLATCLRYFTLPSFISSRGHVDLILFNGPGSCVPIAIAAFLPRVFGLHSPQMIYVESWARVRQLSLSGKILRFLVDRFFLQWETLADKETDRVSRWRARKEYKGVLV